MATAVATHMAVITQEAQTKVEQRSRFDEVLRSIPKHYWFWVGVLLVTIVFWCAVVSYTCVATWNVTSSAPSLMR
jgi:hypothetical protein